MASVFLGDLDDFITPSQACINPLFTSNEKQQQELEKEADKTTSSKAKIVLETDDDFNMEDLSYTTTSITADSHTVIRPNLIKKSTVNEKATVSLDDCLACSGCVTSAETVLISQQSTKEMLQVLQSGQYQKKVVTLSPQSRASLAAHFNLSILSTHLKLVTFFKKIGIDMVIDSTCSGDFALLESRAEFLHRFRNQKKTLWVKPPSSFAHSSKKTEYIELETDKVFEQDPLTALPMLASACPGWICYAEKTQPNAIPFIDTTKSPQQIAGSLIKHFLCKEQSLAPNQIYHVAVMPCFDKKLEASRKDFLDEASEAKDVDCVLATTEIIELLGTLGEDFLQLPEAKLTSDEILLSGISPDGNHILGTSVNAGSGGQLEHIFRYAARELFQVDIQGPLEYVTGRNPDFKEVSLVIEGKEVLKFAIAYGFRNIQSIMTKIRRNKCSYHYVEIMACPSGCLNGGGQIKPASTLQASELLSKVTAKFQELKERSPIENPACKMIYEKYFGGLPFSLQAREVFHTRYHAVPKLEQSNPLGIKW